MSHIWYKDIEEEELNSRFTTWWRWTLVVMKDVKKARYYQLMWGMCRDSFDKAVMLDYWYVGHCKFQGNKLAQINQQKLVQKSKRKAQEIIDATPSWLNVVHGR